MNTASTRDSFNIFEAMEYDGKGHTFLLRRCNGANTVAEQFQSINASPTSGSSPGPQGSIGRLHVLPAVIARQASRPQKRIKCPICDRSMLKRVLDRHLRTVHQQGSDYECSLCGEKFIRPDSVSRHEREQHGDKTGLVECIMCGANVRERYLNDHFRSRKCSDSQAQKDRLDWNATPLLRDNTLGSISNQTGDSVGDLDSLCAYLFVRCTPFGRFDCAFENASFRVFYYPEGKVTVDILELQRLAIRSITRRLENTSWRQHLREALELFTLANIMINGPSSGEGHWRALKKLLGQGVLDPSRARLLLTRAWYDAKARRETPRYSIPHEILPKPWKEAIREWEEFPDFLGVWLSCCYPPSRSALKVA